MAQVPLTLASLGDLDNGAAGLLVNKALRKACEDLDDRGDDGKVRKVLIEVDLSSMKGGQWLADVQVGVKLPSYRTDPTVGATARRNGQDGSPQTEFVFQTHAPDDPNQRTLDEVVDADGEVH